QLLFLDLAELAVYAGCELGKERQRLGTYLELPVLLHVPAFIRGEPAPKPTDDVRMPLGAHALDVVRDWARPRGLDTAIAGDKDISLRDLYTYWCRAATDPRRVPVWRGIPAPDTAGRLPASPPEEARHFLEWARAQAGGLTRWSPGPDRAERP